MIDNMTLSRKLEDNIELFKQILKNHEDINYRIIENYYNRKIKICLISVDDMTDKELINNNIIKPIVLAKIENFKMFNNKLNEIVNSLILANEITKTVNVNIRMIKKWKIIMYKKWPKAFQSPSSNHYLNTES